MDIFTFIYFFGCCLIVLPFSYEIFVLFQQEHYQTKKMLNLLLSHYLHNKAMYAIYGAILLALLVTFGLPTPIYLGTVVAFAWACFLMEKVIIPLKITPRIIRLTVTYLVVLFLLVLFLIYSEFYLGFALLIILIPLITFIANYINLPCEMLIRHYYLEKAKSKLKQMRHLMKIGITGSFGKTSTKNIINQLISDDFITCSTPKSFNTPLGIALTINNLMPSFVEVLICEMGAFRLNEIKYLAHFVKPQIAILTDVGPQHLSTFKTIENVLKAKMEIFENNNPPTIGIVNGDSVLISEYISKWNTSKIEWIRVGIENSKANIYATDIVINANSTSFSVVINGEKIEHFETPLLGKHNIYNILFGIATIIALQSLGYDLDIRSLKAKIKSLKPIEHRMEYQKWDKWEVYDDSYNANLQGCINSLTVFKKCAAKKFIITPGIVDAGKEMKNVNMTIAKELVNDLDYVLLIDNEASRIIKEYFMEQDFNNYTMLNSFKEAISYLKTNYQNEHICLLIENDLPDHFLRRK